MPAVRGSRASNSSTAAAVAAATTTTTSNDTNTDLPIDPSLNDMNNGMMIPPPGMQAGPPGGGHQMMMPTQAGMDDGDNRTRNAKAQRRHREKRKAHLKALEDSVQLLTLQLEDARRQLAQSAYYNSQRPGGAPMSPQSKDFAQLQAENAYLRDENADLRRQLYSYRMNYGNPSTPADGNKDGQGQNGQQAGNGAGSSNGQQGWEVKPDQGFVYQPGMSPRRSGDASVQSAPENGPSSASSSSGIFQPMDHQHQHFTPIHQRSRSRNMSQTASPVQPGQGHTASPYMNNENRPVDARYSASGMRPYDPPTPVFPPQHSVPRYDAHNHYTPRPSDEPVSWPPESGPPPFPGYSLNFGENSGEEWRAQDT